MKRELMDILCCPACKKDLELTVEEEKDGEIITGNLHCKNCSRDFPIEEAIPNMLLDDQ